MKTPEQVISDIDQLSSPYRETYSAPPQKKITKQIDVLQGFVRYLTGNPPEAEVAAQLHRTEREIHILESRFENFKAPEDVKSKGDRAIRSYYNKLNGIGDLKRKRHNLKYLLS